MPSLKAVPLLALLALATLQPMATGRAMPRSAEHAGRTYYVATSGDDAQDGLSLDHPFRHIQRCADLMAAGDTCLVRAGVYGETVRPARSGRAGAPLLFAPYAGEPVTISGSDPVDGWSLYRGHVYRAPVRIARPAVTSADEQVFAGGRMLGAAQWPPLGSVPGATTPMSPTEALAGPGTRAGLICDPHLSIFPAHFWKGALLHVWAGFGWWASTVFVTDSGVGGGCGAGVGYLTFPAMPVTTGPGFDPLPRNPYHLLAATAAQALAPQLAACDGAGQFFYDGSYLYAWMPDGDRPAAHRVEVRQRDRAFDLAERSYITVGAVQQQRGFHLFAATVRTSAGSDHDVLDGLDVRYPSHFATFISDTTHALTNGDQARLDSGILLAGSYDQLLNSSIAISAGNGVALGGDHALVRNNLISDVAYAGSDGAGIAGEIWEYDGMGATNSEIDHNTIHDSGMAGMIMPALHNTVIYNNIYRTGALTNDVGGGFLSDWYYGPGCLACGAAGQGGAGTPEARSLFAYNWVHDNLDTAARSHTFCPDAAAGTCADASTGIYLDISAGPWTVHHNVVWGETSADLTLNGNAGDFGGPPGNQHNLIYNNTLASTTPGVLSVSAMYEDSVMTGTVLMNNVLVAPATITMGTTPPTLATNMRDTRLAEFVDPAAHDYHLRAGSSLIGKGTFVAGITTGQAPGSVDPGAYATSGGGPNQTWGPPGCRFAGCL